jgi:hypothetical protein
VIKEFNKLKDSGCGESLDSYCAIRIERKINSELLPYSIVIVIYDSE